MNSATAARFKHSYHLLSAVLNTIPQILLLFGRPAFKSLLLSVYGHEKPMGPTITRAGVFYIAGLVSFSIVHSFLLFLT